MANGRVILPGLVLVFLLAPISSPHSDFAMSASPSSMEVIRGSLGTSTMTLTSLFNFEGTVDLTASISPLVENGPTFSIDASPVFVTARGSSTSGLTVRASADTPLRTYSVTVTGTSGSIIHAIDVVVKISLEPPSPAVGGSLDPTGISAFLTPSLGLGLAVLAAIVAIVVYLNRTKRHVNKTA